MTDGGQTTYSHFFPSTPQRRPLLSLSLSSLLPLSSPRQPQDLLHGAQDPPRVLEGRGVRQGALRAARALRRALPRGQVHARRRRRGPARQGQEPRGGGQVPGAGRGGLQPDRRQAADADDPHAVLAHRVPDPIRLDGARLARHQPVHDQGEPRRRADVRRVGALVPRPGAARAADGDHAVPARGARGQAVASRG